MKRLVRSRSDRQIYGQKWQNIELSSETEIDDGLHPAAIESGNRHHSASVESTEIIQVSVPDQPGNTMPIITEANVVRPPTTGQLEGQENENQTWKGNRTGSYSDRQLMYKAALEGDWLAAEVLLAREKTLACDELTERGDRALHVAAAMKHKKFVQNLVERMKPSDLALQDGRGYTASCYAAILGAVKIEDIMMNKNPNLGTARDKNNETPLHKAASRGNAELFSYFLKSTQIEDLSKEEWFDLLLVTIRRKMYDVALEILGINGSLATMTNKEGTALHLLARQNISCVNTSKKSKLWERLFGSESALTKMQPDVRLLAEKLWAEIQKSEKPCAHELIKRPPILHNAAKVGNVELITMLTHTYPDLIWDTDSNGYTMFHIAVVYRQENVFKLIHQIGAMKDLIAISQDKKGNNILHLAAALAPPITRKIVPVSALQMQREITWYKKVESIVTPSCLEMRNRKGHRPRELFSVQHKKLLEKSETWLRNTADSCMLIITIMLTVVFSAAFTAPGGYNGETGIPILYKSNWFTCFIIFEALALFGSTLCIISFWSIMTSSFEEDKFLESLPDQLKRGLSGLFVSLIGTISAFMSAYFLVFVQERAALIKSVVLFVYIILVSAIINQFSILWLHMTLPELLSRTVTSQSKHTLFSRTTEE